MIRKFCLFIGFLFFHLISQAQGVLENPAADSAESGIGIISGWHCTASRIDFYMDDKSIGHALVSSDRGDTAGICGKPNTGFSFLINYNVLTPGTHNVKAYANGALFGDSTFVTTQSGGVDFLQGAAKNVVVDDFPTQGNSVTLIWNQSKQSFVVNRVSAAMPTTGAATGIAKLYGLVTLKFKFNGGTNIYSNSANLSAVDLDATGFLSKKINATQYIDCGIIPVAGWDFMCVIGSQPGQDRAVDAFLVSVSSRGIVSGLYHFCEVTVSSELCGATLMLTPHGTVWGDVVTSTSASAGVAASASLAQSSVPGSETINEPANGALDQSAQAVKAMARIIDRARLLHNP